MILTKKYIAAVFAIIFVLAAVFTAAIKNENCQTIADNNFKIVLDAGHGAYE